MNKEQMNKYARRCLKAIKYNEYLKEHCKYRLKKGHLRKIGRILRGGND